jgi:hypothetical protein
MAWWFRASGHLVKIVLLIKMDPVSRDACGIFTARRVTRGRGVSPSCELAGQDLDEDDREGGEGAQCDEQYRLLVQLTRVVRRMNLMETVFSIAN